MRYTYLACVTCVLFTTSAFAAAPVQVNVTYNEKTMCLHGGVPYSLGDRVVVDGKTLECVNARKTSYFLDDHENARWVPEEYAAKQKNGVSLR